MISYFWLWSFLYTNSILWFYAHNWYQSHSFKIKYFIFIYYHISLRKGVNQFSFMMHGRLACIINLLFYPIRPITCSDVKFIVLNWWITIDSLLSVRVLLRVVASGGHPPSRRDRLCNTTPCDSCNNVTTHDDYGGCTMPLCMMATVVLLL